MICLYHTCYLILDYRYYQRKIYKTYYLFPFSTHLHVLFLLKQYRRLYNFSCTKLILRNFYYIKGQKFYYLKGQKLLLPQRPKEVFDIQCTCEWCNYILNSFYRVIEDTVVCHFLWCYWPTYWDGGHLCCYFHILFSCS